MATMADAINNTVGTESRDMRAAALDVLGNGESSSEDVNLAMLRFNEASAKFNAAIKTAQEEPNSIRRNTQAQQA